MNKEDRIFQLAVQLFLKKPLPTYLHNENEKVFRGTARDTIEVARLFVEEYENPMKESSNPPPDEL